MIEMQVTLKELQIIVSRKLKKIQLNHNRNLFKYFSSGQIPFTLEKAITL